VRFLLNDIHRRRGTATALIVIYSFLLFMMAISYFRILYIVTFDPGYIPLGPQALSRKQNGSKGSNGQTPQPRGTSDAFAGRDYSSTEAGFGLVLTFFEPKSLYSAHI
jgi:hypothetical protein